MIHKIKIFILRAYFKIRNSYKHLHFFKERYNYKQWLQNEGKNLSSYSQYGQDLFVRYYFARYYAQHEICFIDIGANDGISLSNTYALSNGGGGGGILIEADREVFAKLLANRPDIVDMTHNFCSSSHKIYAYNVAIFERDENLSFMQISGAAQMLSGIINNYHPLHLERIKREVAKSGGSYEILTIQAMRLDTLLAQHPNFKHIDYLSIDVEGAEMSVLKSINFEKTPIRLISVENNYKSREIHKFLRQHGYKQCFILGCDEFWEHRL